MFKAEKEIVGEFMHHIIWSVSIIFIIAFVFVLKDISDNNHVSQYTSQLVERLGGVNALSRQEFNHYNNKYFGGRYTLDTANTNPKQYGEKIEYRISTNLRIIYFNIPIKIEFGGVAISRKRR